MSKSVFIKRIEEAQREVFSLALNEIKVNAKKTSHWIWFVFPCLYDIPGISQSSNFEYYQIPSIKEAREFLNNFYLRKNLLSICEALLQYKGKKSIKEIFGNDSKKVHSCITLFLQVENNNKILNEVLNVFFDGIECSKTKNKLRLLENE